MRTVCTWSASCLLLAVGATAHASDFEREVGVQPKGVVDISNVSGSIEVSAWDRPEVSVRAELGRGVDHVDVSTEGTRTTIKVVLPSGHSMGSGEAELHVSAVSADVTTSGVQGVQRLSAVSGDVDVEIAGSDFELKTVSGDVKVKGHGQPARLHLNTVSGDVHLEHGAGDFEASTVSGTLVVSLDSATSVRAHTTSGDLRFN